MSELITQQVSVLLGTVPLFAVNRISLNERYELPPVGDKGLSQSTSKITRTVQIEAALLGADGPVTRLGLEMMADLSKTLPLASSILSGIPMVAGLTTLMDMQIDSLSFSQSADEKGVYAVSISLKHCPRPGLMALLSAVTNAASAIVGAAALSSATPRKVWAMTPNTAALAPLPPWPDDGLAYAPLPASGDDGFPQMFLLQVRQTVYRLTMTVYYPDPAFVLDPAYATTVFDLPDAARGLYLNLRAEYENLPAATRLIGARRVVLNMPIALGPLRFRFGRIRIAQANLSGPGAFGSALVADVAVIDA